MMGFTEPLELSGRTGTGFLMLRALLSLLFFRSRGILRMLKPLTAFLVVLFLLLATD